MAVDQWVRGVARRAGEVVELEPAEGAELCAARLAVPARRARETATLRTPERAISHELHESDERKV